MGLADRPDIEMDGGNLVVTYTKPLDAGESFQIAGMPIASIAMCRARAGKAVRPNNVEGQHSFRLTPRYHLLWGGGVRSTLSRTKPTALIFFEPNDRTINQVHGFAQTEITFTPKLSATFGKRGERMTFSGFELQPAIRAKYTPRASTIVWGAISRAVRTPPRFDQTCACCSTASSPGGTVNSSRGT